MRLSGPELVVLTGDLDGEMNIGQFPDNDFLSGDFVADLKNMFKGGTVSFSPEKGVQFQKQDTASGIPAPKPQLKNMLIIGGAVALALYLLTRRK